MTFSQKAEEIKQAELIADLNEQINEELGTGPARLLVTKAEERMVQQKYGLMPPQFTNKEKKVIQREQRKHARA